MWLETGASNFNCEERFILGNINGDSVHRHYVDLVTFEFSSLNYATSCWYGTWWRKVSFKLEVFRRPFISDGWFRTRLSEATVILTYELLTSKR